MKIGVFGLLYYHNSVLACELDLANIVPFHVVTYVEYYLGGVHDIVFRQLGQCGAIKSICTRNSPLSCIFRARNPNS